MTFDAPYRVHHLGPAVLAVPSFLLNNTLIYAAVFTIIFAVVPRVTRKRWLLKDWSHPSRLPAVVHSERILRARSKFILVFGIIFGVWWLRALWTLRVIDFEILKVSLSPAWHRFFWVFLPLGSLIIGLTAINLCRPYWTRTRRLVKGAKKLCHCRRCSRCRPDHESAAASIDPHLGWACG